MSFKQIMGIIYLTLFIGVMTYKFNYFVSDQQDSFALIILVLAILAILLLAIRKILMEG